MTDDLDFDSALAQLNPTSCGTYVYCPAEHLPDSVTPFATIREHEGPCALVPLEQAEAHELDVAHEPLTRISLGVTTNVRLQGLTGAVAQNLAAAQIPCNIISGMRHDHLFVPKRHAIDAMNHLKRLSKQARAWANA